MFYKMDNFVSEVLITFSILLIIKNISSYNFLIILCWETIFFPVFCQNRRYNVSRMLDIRCRTEVRRDRQNWIR